MPTEEELSRFRREARVFTNIQSSRIPLHTRTIHRIDVLKKVAGNAAAFKSIDKFLKGEIEKPILLIIGTPGVGKTSLSHAVAWEFLEDALNVQYWQVEELLNELQVNQTNGQIYGRIWRHLRDCDLLILDDLGAHNPTVWRDSQLDAMVDYRYRENAPLIITANKLNTISDRITDRIKEGQTVMITGRSWRGRSKEEE